MSLDFYNMYIYGRVVSSSSSYITLASVRALAPRTRHEFIYARIHGVYTRLVVGTGELHGVHRTRGEHNSGENFSRV